MERAAGGDQDPAGGQRAHGAEVDFPVAAERGGDRAAVLGECRGVEDDGVEPLPRPGEGAERLERVAFAPLDIAEPIERGIGGTAAKRVGARVEREDAAGAARQVQGEGAVVGEAVEGPAARRRQRAGQQAVGDADRGRRPVFWPSQGAAR